MVLVDYTNKASAKLVDIRSEITSSTVNDTASRIYRNGLVLAELPNFHKKSKYRCAT